MKIDEFERIIPSEHRPRFLIWLYARGLDIADISNHAWWRLWRKFEKEILKR